VKATGCVQALCRYRATELNRFGYSKGPGTTPLWIRGATVRKYHHIRASAYKDFDCIDTNKYLGGGPRLGQEYSHPNTPYM
jgi:hypothetical protein